jgi:hypothetical protein
VKLIGNEVHDFVEEHYPFVEHNLILSDDNHFEV